MLEIDCLESPVGELVEIHAFQYEEPVRILYVPSQITPLPVLHELDLIDWEWP